MGVDGREQPVEEVVGDPRRQGGGHQQLVTAPVTEHAAWHPRDFLCLISEVVIHDARRGDCVNAELRGPVWGAQRPPAWLIARFDSQNGNDRPPRPVLCISQKRVDFWGGPVNRYRFRHGTSRGRLHLHDSKEA